jgi:hypothetical protein
MAWYTYQIDENWFGQSDNIKVITATICDATVLVLLMGMIYEVHRWDGTWPHDTDIKFHEDWLGNSDNVKAITSIIWDVSVLVLLMTRIS